MKWEWLDLVTDSLNPDALAECRESIVSMSPWMQAVLVAAALLLVGTALVELLSGLKMEKYARFVGGLAVGFAVCFLILRNNPDLDDVKLLLYSLAAGVAAGVLNAFLERIYRFAVGFLYGTALGTWLVPFALKKDLAENPGRVYRLLIALAAGLLFALLAKKLKFILTALLGGTILGLLIESFVPYENLPYLPEMLELSEGMYRNILPLVLAGIGILIQLPQLVSLIRQKREMQIPPGNAMDIFYGSSEEEDAPQQETEDASTSEAISVAQAEAVLVEKARELALAASRSAEDIRLRERYEDVAEGMYNPKTAARRLGITEEDFLAGMRQSGYTVPGEELPGESSETVNPEESAPAGNAEETNPADKPEGTDPAGNAEETNPAENTEGTAPAGNTEEMNPAENQEGTDPAGSAEETAPEDLSEEAAPPDLPETEVPESTFDNMLRNVMSHGMAQRMAQKKHLRKISQKKLPQRVYHQKKPLRKMSRRRMLRAVTQKKTAEGYGKD